jgi:DNA-directed RNA polymerase subunit alpha
LGFDLKFTIYNLKLTQMEYTFLSKNVAIKKVSETASEGVFEINNLYTGYGITLGNALRRVLLSSLPGAAVTQVKIKGAKHEFTAVPDVMEDAIDIILNLKKLRMMFFADESQTLTIKKKGAGAVTAADIHVPSQVKIVNPDLHIATISSKSGELEMEIIVEKGLGYSPAETRKMEKLPVGTIALDALFSPVSQVQFEVENMRVGDRTDFNRLTLRIQTDGTMSPSRALHKAANILKDHLEVVSTVETKDFEGEPEEGKSRRKVGTPTELSEEKAAKKATKKAKK